MGSERELKFVLDLDPEVARWRRRALFLLSVVFHGVLILVILVSPDLIRRMTAIFGVKVEPAAPKRETTYLWFPPDLIKRLQEPPDTRALSDRNRRAQGPSPIVDPFGSRQPFSQGNTPLPEIPGGQPKPTPPAAAPTPPGGPTTSAAAAPPPPKKDDGLRLMDVPKTSAEGEGTLSRLSLGTPGEAIQQSLQAAPHRAGSQGGPGGPGDSLAQFQNLRPNFSTQAPIILSDTRGVDFGPYLARVVYTVRRNWYAVIPETARLGEKGRVALVFEIIKDGTVPNLRLVASSGSDALDRAAAAGIRASVPFPPLPEEFTGNHLVLEFIFLYNLDYAP